MPSANRRLDSLRLSGSRCQSTSEAFVARVLSASCLGSEVVLVVGAGDLLVRSGHQQLRCEARFRTPNLRIVDWAFSHELRRTTVSSLTMYTTGTLTTRRVLQDQGGGQPADLVCGAHVNGSYGGKQILMSSRTAISGFTESERPPQVTTPHRGRSRCRQATAIGRRHRLQSRDTRAGKPPSGPCCATPTA